MEMKMINIFSVHSITKKKAKKTKTKTKTKKKQTKKNQGKQFQRMYICYSPTERSVLGKTVPEVLDQCSRQRALYFLIRTDLSWWITFLFFFSGNLQKCLQKETEWLRAVIRARSSINKTFFQQVGSIENRGNANWRFHQNIIPFPHGRKL